MRIHVTSIRAVFCIATTVLGVVLFPSPRLLGGEKARPIASMTAHERMNLPDSTQVTLKYGKTVSLGALRAEHQARLERFSRAAELGKIANGKLASHPVNSAQLSPAATAKAGSPITPAGKGIAVKKGDMQAGPTISLPPSLVPFHMPDSAYPLPKDYVDFCKAANSSLCIYLPASSTGYDAGTTLAVDIDPLITDTSVCDYDGGVLATDLPACMFYYPYVLTTNFKPTGPIDKYAVCDPRFHYVVDPRGAIQAAYPTVPGKRDIKYLFNDNRLATCVVQVWIQNGK